MTHYLLTQRCEKLAQQIVGIYGYMIKADSEEALKYSRLDKKSRAYFMKQIEATLHNQNEFATQVFAATLKSYFYGISAEVLM